jgi:hypothetical protein
MLEESKQSQIELLRMNDSSTERKIEIVDRELENDNNSDD